VRTARPGGGEPDSDMVGPENPNRIASTAAPQHSNTSTLPVAAVPAKASGGAS
jgi:hypothetical protein